MNKTNDLLSKIDTFLKYLTKGFIVFVIFWCSSYLQYIPVKIFHIDIHNIDTTMKVILSLFSSLIIFCIYFIIYRKDLIKDFKDYRQHKEEYKDIGIRYWLIGLFLMMIINYILNVVLKAGGANNEKAVQQMIASCPLLMLIEAGIIAPFNEEIVFRKSLKDTFKNKWIFIILSFLLFGGAHVLSSAKVMTDYLYIIPYGLLGASFAMAYYKTNNIFTSISMHMIHNTILVLISIATLFLK